jgi:Predicted RNA-binding protein
MTKYIETTGKTEEEAIGKALAQLGLERDDVSVELIERAKSGFLGLGGNPARVRISYEAPEETEESTPAPSEPIAAAPCAAAAEPSEETAPVPKSTVPAAADDEQAEKIQAFLTGLLAHLDSSAVPEITVD